MISRALKRIAGRQPDGRLQEIKLRALAAACGRVDCHSLADLGGVWAVDGGYALRAADAHNVERVVICDDDFTEPVLDRASRDDRIELVEGNFGEVETASRIGNVDVILMFDILLHQVNPDWDQILEIYSPHARCITLAGPWWNGERTERLVDLDRDAYLAQIPNRSFHEQVIDRLNEINDRRGRPWRDCHDIWQWGITDAGLRARMGALGFKLAFHENLGRWQGYERFDNSSYVFVAE